MTQRALTSDEYEKWPQLFPIQTTNAIIKEIDLLIECNCLHLIIHKEVWNDEMINHDSNGPRAIRRSLGWSVVGLPANGKMVPGVFRVNITVSDNGLEVRKRETSVFVFIADVNECAIILEPKENEIITINSTVERGFEIYSIKAKDNDFGFNANII